MWRKNLLLYYVEVVLKYRVEEKEVAHETFWVKEAVDGYLLDTEEVVSVSKPIVINEG